MAATLTEPAVLAAAKETLYPDLDADTCTYAVTETQFTTSNWDGWMIPYDIRQRLTTHNPGYFSSVGSIRVACHADI